MLFIVLKTFFRRTEVYTIAPVLDPTADFQEGSYGYRPKRQAAEAIARVSKAIITRKTRILDLDISKFFDNVRQTRCVIAENSNASTR